MRDTVAGKVASGLEAEGFTVVGPDERAVGLLECESGDCARTVLASVSADFGIAVAVWSRSYSDSQRPYSATSCAPSKASSFTFVATPPGPENPVIFPAAEMIR